ncbi:MULTISPECIES: sigma-54-dependent Fis family transcriptional regulator [unclassified Variovorax]|uniref:sigma-54 interaction domain-containing protein n=1 Tax=unclassified Variovorax TaxID=663243 RepID=UPI00210EE8AB|nr:MULTISPECIES: sigma 54-interacting transcriptional regulator [unclassified Variovorax]
MKTREEQQETQPENADSIGQDAALKGILVLGADGQLKSALGIASRSEFAVRMHQRWLEANEDGQSVFVVDDEPNGPRVVIALTSDEGTVLVALQHDRRNALMELVASVDFSGDILQHLLTNPFEALTVVDHAGVVRYISPIHEKFFGIAPGGGTGRHVTQVIENTRLHTVAATGKAEIGSLQPMRGGSRVVSRHPVLGRDGKVVGAIGQVMFKGPEQLQVMSAELKRLQAEVGFYRRELNGLRNRSYGLEHIVGNSGAIERLKRQIVKVASMDIPVLLTGESGTGKELAAHAIHLLSNRRDANMVMVNAAALPATLVESELFGYEAGSFTGAERKGRRGKIEQADKGSLFFDEVGDMPAEVQVKLLRVLQDGRFERVGGHESKLSSFRLISASNRNFDQMIEEGTFRLDLFYRISAVTIRMPALRERREDIPLLADLALRNFASRHGLQPKKMSADALLFLHGLDWPGNVRQLIHTVERAAIFSESDVIEPPDFGLLDDTLDEVQAPPSPSLTTDSVVEALRPEPLPLDGGRTETLGVRRAVGEVEEQLIRAAMVKCRGNKKQAAVELGISRSYLYKRLGELEIQG